MTMEVLTECSPLTDVVNNNIKHTEPFNTPTKVECAPVCVGCNRPITDQYVMIIQPDIHWHMACLKCDDCNRYLDETCTCFFKAGRVLCKADYQRLMNTCSFSSACSKCSTPFNRGDLVMRAQDNVYHIDCFQCTACSRLLVPGDKFALREGGLYCREDNEVLDRNLLDTDDSRLHNLHNNNHITIDKQRSTTQHENNSSNKLKRTKDGKPTRVRTVLSEKQLHTLRTCYGANPRPDALMKEQLVELTGLSPRVIRVWFQNKRCKDKKKSMLLKHMQQQEKNLSTGMQGVPMVAQSPLRHDNGLQSIDSYHHQSWKRIPEFQANQHDEINHNSFSSLMGSLYSTDDSAVYLGEEDYMDCVQPGSVSSQFSRASTSPNSSG